MNESTAFSDRGLNARIAWVHEMAALIREYDKNHMISAGALGYTLLREREEWLRIQQLPEVDFCDSHIYPESLEGFKMAAGPGACWSYSTIARRCVATSPKALVIGEFAYHTDAGQTLYGRPRASGFRFPSTIAIAGAAPWSGCMSRISCGVARCATLLSTSTIPIPTMCGRCSARWPAS